MGTTAEKLAHTLACKEAIKAAIQEKGVSIDASTKFADYAGKIESIETGTDTSDATATAADIRNGKTAYGAAGTKLTGTMTDEFFVCLSTDDSAKTWSGRKLELNADGFYEATGDVINNIPYYGFVPVAGSYYDKKTLVKIEKLYNPSAYLEGIVFAADMQTNEAIYNGQTVQLSGGNIVAAPGYTDGTKALNASNCEFDIDGKTDFANNEISYAVTIYYDSQGSAGDLRVIELRDLEDDGSGAGAVQLAYNGSNFYGPIYTKLGGSLSSLNPGYGWHHIVLTSNNSKVIGYCDGIQFATGDDNGYGVPSDYEKLYLRTACHKNNVYLKDVQVYNRVLAADEVESLFAAAKLPTA